MIREINAAQARKWLEDGEAIMVDVREEEEYNDAHIDDVTLLPLSRFDLQSVPEPGDKKLIFQCKAGGRSMKACEVYAMAHPEKDVYNLAGGIGDWIEAGLPVTRS